ncbi:pyridoxal-phosphate dependent enzyme [Nitrospira lenta]|uniref:Putative serine racemase n=1 Tax=Nitrospira lenta TaxID=1436998 RepID=A0A330L3F4_9BACT|nr:pyridoxal-phosphate dependent enzyme [Nitrospira lenta]SPP64364.1 putative serine racemase [Nitrospira lenta]
MGIEVFFEDILRARETLHNVSLITPVKTSVALDDVTSATVFLKCETAQRTGSFKFRGAYNAASQVTAKGSGRTVATISSGNHGQGLALAASLLHLSAYVIVPKPYVPRKRLAIAQHGAHVIVVEDRAAAEQALHDTLAQEHARQIHAFNDPQVIAGQGTIMLELLQQVSHLDVVLAPVGGGGLLSGLCVAAHHLNPHLLLYACEPLGAADAIESLRRNEVLPMINPCTLADGLRTSLGSRTLPILKQHLTDVLLVSEEEILTAMQFAQEKLQLEIEPSSAVALAPLLRREPALVGRRVGVILTGGNVDLDSF